MASDTLEPVYLLMGTDRPKIGRALERLRARVGEDATEQLGAPTTGDDAVAACNTLGMFGGDRRLVVVDGVGIDREVDRIAGVASSRDPVSRAGCGEHRRRPHRLQDI